MIRKTSILLLTLAALVFVAAPGNTARADSCNSWGTNCDGTLQCSTASSCSACDKTTGHNVTGVSPPLGMSVRVNYDCGTRGIEITGDWQTGFSSYSMFVHVYDFNNNQLKSLSFPSDGSPRTINTGPLAGTPRVVRVQLHQSSPGGSVGHEAYTFVVCLPTRICCTNCDDGNVCTSDSCQYSTGTCRHTNRTGSCGGSTGNECTRFACQQGQCQEVDKNTGSCGGETGNVCTRMACRQGTCQEVNRNESSSCGTSTQCTKFRCQSGTCAELPRREGNSCDDANACTSNETCQSGVCTAGSRVDCGPGTTCMGSSCNPSTGTCQSFPRNHGIACGGDDGNVCTTNRCSAGSCVSTHNNGLACSDGSVCTTGDVCSGGTCQPGSICEESEACLRGCDGGECGPDPVTGVCGCRPVVTVPVLIDEDLIVPVKIRK